MVTFNVVAIVCILAGYTHDQVSHNIVFKMISMLIPYKTHDVSKPNFDELKLAQARHHELTSGD